MNQEKKPSSFKKTTNFIFIYMMGASLFLVGLGAMNAFVWHEEVTAQNLMVWSMTMMSLGIALFSFYHVLHVQKILQKHGLWQDEQFTKNFKF